MGIFYGGIAQIIAGLLEYKKDNNIGMTACASYSVFWLTLIGILMLTKIGLTGSQQGTVPWGVHGLLERFHPVHVFGKLCAKRALQFVLASLILLFALLAIFTVNYGLLTSAGYEGTVCGVSAILSSYNKSAECAV
ncbi:MAG: acetate uptake transporter [Candidatus Malihini olakiniferum]